MTTPGAAPRPSLLAAGRSVWAWWLGEMRDLGTARLRSERRRKIDADIHLGRDYWTIRDRRGSSIPVEPGDGAALVQAIEALKGRRKQARVAVTVPLSRCFVRHTALPRAMLGHAGSILGSELDGTTPFPNGSVHWDWFAHDKGAARGSLAVTQVVLKRRDTEPVLARLADAGAVLVRIGVEDDGLEPVRRLPLDLLRHGGDLDHEAQGLRKARRMLMVAACLATLAIVPTAFMQQSSTLAALDQEILEAQDAVALKPGLARAPLEAVGEALRVKRETPPADLVLDKLASALPSDSALDHLFLDKDVVTVQGRTASIANLERALAASPLFSVGHNSAPASAGADALPFTIRLKMRPMPSGPDA